MDLLNYVDTREAAISALKDLANVKREYETLPGGIAFTTDEIRKLEHSIQRYPGNRKATKLETLREKYATLKLKHVELDEYLSCFAACWERLTDEEQDALYYRFFGDSGGMRGFMVKYPMGRANAYRISDAALQRFSKLLYW